ncbi:hypothetical protein [Streptomyces sp. NPDC049813]|uniref:hypothetical protein n=1 Tax=Streptomyces sp. NPDC049813 TaxID=3365597 RepID=UPI00378D55F5
MTSRRSAGAAALAALGVTLLLGPAATTAAALPHSHSAGAAHEDDPAPGLPTGFQVLYDAGTETATVSWDANTEDDLAGYRLYRRDVGDGGDGGGAEGGEWALVSGAALLTATTTTDHLPASGNTYAYSLRAVDRAGNELPPGGGDDWYVETPDASPPSVPADLTALGTTAGNTVRWQASSDHVDHYEVWAEPEGQQDPDGPESVYGTGFTDAQAAWGVSVTYTVEAVDASGQRSGVSAPVTAARPAPGAAPRPAGVTAQVRGDKVRISWDAGSGDMGQSYRVYAHRYPDPAAWTLAATAYPQGGTVAFTAASGPFYVVSVDDEGRESAPVYTYA